MIQSGSVIEFQSFPSITHEQLRAYAEASGDFNPIHLDENVAKKVGLPGVIAHGMLIAGMMAERARQFALQSVEAPHGKWVLQKFQSRFKAMTLVGDTPSVGGVVKEVSSDGLVLELQSKNQRGEITTIGNVKFILE